MKVLEAREGFKFGCDPELFVLNTEGIPVSAEGLIPGTKFKPYPVPFGAVQVDGMAAEVNIDPAETFEDFDRNIVSVLASLKKMLPKGYTLLASPAITFSEEEWEKAPPSAKALGCMPDFNAWTGNMNPPPFDPTSPRMRTAAGHLHIGWTDDADLGDVQHLLHCQDLVKQLDWFLGGWSITKDTDKDRRRLYGKAGSCRYKPYGVEYRVLSNFWVTSKKMRLEVWNRMQAAIEEMPYTFMPTEYPSYVPQLIKAINSGERDDYFERSFPFPLKQYVRY